MGRILRKGVISMPNHQEDEQILDPKELSMEQQEQQKKENQKESQDNDSLNKHLEGPNRPAT